MRELESIFDLTFQLSSKTFVQFPGGCADVSLVLLRALSTQIDGRLRQLVQAEFS